MRLRFRILAFLPVILVIVSAFTATPGLVAGIDSGVVAEQTTSVSTESATETPSPTTTATETPSSTTTQLSTTTEAATSTPISTSQANASKVVRQKVAGGLLLNLKSPSSENESESTVASASETDTQMVSVIVYTDTKLSNSRITELQAAGIHIEQESWIPKESDGGSYHARAPADALSTLAQTASVRRIDPGTAELTLDDSVPMTNATDVHNNTIGGPSANKDRSLTGQNVRVAVIDTGIDDSHPAIQGKVVAGEDYVGDGNTHDENGHGTHVAATIASSNNTHTGVAPGVDLIDLDVGDSSAGGLSGDISQAITDAATEYNADVISMSLGRTGGLASHRTGTSRLDDAVRQARANGSVVVVSAGNAGDASTHARDTVPSQGSVWVDIESDGSSATGAFHMVHPGYSDLTFELYNTDTGNQITSNFLRRIGGSGQYTYRDNRAFDQKEYIHDFLGFTDFSDTTSSNDEYALRVVNNDSQPVTFDIYQENGNTVTFANKTSEKRTLTSPSTSSAAVAVGAVVANDTWIDSRGQSHTWLNDDQRGELSYLSSQGPTVDGRTKPEVVAPGEAIVSATSSRAPYRPAFVVNNGTGSVTMTGSGTFEDLEGGWAVKSGTSMAAPHVAGQAALLIQKSRAVDARDPAPRTIKASLMQSGTDPDQSTHLQTKMTNRTGAGLINAQYGLATIALTDETRGETDTVWLQYPDDGDRTRLGFHAAVQLNASGSPWEDEPQDVAVSLGSPTSPFRYSRKATVANVSFQPGEKNALSIAGGNSLVDWSAATVLPPANTTTLSTTFPGSNTVSKTVHGYHRVSDAELDPGAAAAYAVPVDRALASDDFEPRHGSVRATAYWNKTTSDVDIRIEQRDGTVLGNSSVHGSIPVAHAIGSSTPGGHKVMFTAHNASEKFDSTFASNYPLVSLPSSINVTDDDMTAGNASNPNPIEFDVSVENANRPYSAGLYGQVEKNHFTVMVGQKQVPSDSLTVTSPTPVSGEYHLKFTPPKQPQSGQFDLMVAFNDTKLNVSHTARTTETNAVDYTGVSTGAGASATVLIVDDSGSMSGTKMSDAKQAAKEYVTLLSNSDKAGVVRYDSFASTAYSLALARGNRSGMRSDIENLDAGGGTDIGEALNVGYREITKAAASTPKAAVLLTDGNHNGFVSPRSADDQYAAADIPVYTIALGSGADEALLKDIASTTAGEFKSTPTSANLADIYADIGQTVTGSSLIGTTNGTVSAGNTTSESFSVDDGASTIKTRTKLSSGGSTASTGVQTTASSTGPSVRLNYPNGTTVSMTDTGAGYKADPPNVEYTKIGNTHIYRVDDPNPGSWETTIKSSQSQSVDYSTRVTGSASTTLSLNKGSDKYVNGSSTTLAAQFVDRTGGISGASVTANVTYPNGSTKQVMLTAEGTGVYKHDIRNTNNGKMSATVDATKGNITRQQSTSWSVVDASSVLKTAPANASTPSGVEGSSIAAGVDLTLPTVSSSSTVNAGTDKEASIDSEESDFQSAVREVAASRPGTYNESAVDPAVQQAAEALRNQSNDTTTGSTTIQVTSPGSSGKRAYLQIGKLTGPNNATIASSNAQVTQSVVSLVSGQTKTVFVRVTPPNSVTPGTYTGPLEVSIGGTLLTYDVKINVTEATATTYKTRIGDAVKKWQNAGSSGKSYYEEQIAGHLTQLYFDTNSGGSGGSSTSVTTQNTYDTSNTVTTFAYANDRKSPSSDATIEVGETYQHNIAVDTNASSGPIELVLFYNESAAITYESHTATLGGNSVSMQTDTSTVTVDGRQLTRIRFVHRSPSVTGTETLRLMTKLRMPNSRTSELVYSGGADGQSSTTLSRRSTSVDVTNMTGGPGDINGNGNAAADPDSDGLYEDVNGDGTVGINDVQALFAADIAARIDSTDTAFDFSNDNTVNINDVQALFSQEI